MRRLPVGPSLLCLLALLAGCDRGETRVDGRYLLAGTARQPLPVQVREQDGCVFELLGGSITLGEKQDYGSEFQFRARCRETPDAAEVTTMFDHQGAGTFRIRADSIFLVSREGQPDGAGTLRRGTLRIAGPAHTLVYRRPAGPGS
jgi:hypothetical protein